MVHTEKWGAVTLLFLFFTMPIVAMAEMSITSTGVSDPTGGTVLASPVIKSLRYNIFPANDLGMHCGDLDTRVLAILPPFNVERVHVVDKGLSGRKPSLLGPSNGTLTYNAWGNPGDPVALEAPVSPVFKGNFWDNFNMYDWAYPVGTLDALMGPDIGLPVPDLWELQDGVLAVEQSALPGITNPYVANVPQPFHTYYGEEGYPFFLDLGGYVAPVKRLWAADGIPMVPFDDRGRVNPYPMLLVQFKIGSTVVSSVPTVAPVSGETSCWHCHAAPLDGGNGSALPAEVELAENDPQYGIVPSEVSREWATDWNILALHDATHSTNLVGQVEDGMPVSCQRCHWSPALDLTQVGPQGVVDLGPSTPWQVPHPSMSLAMHGKHAEVVDLTQPMPLPVVGGVERNPQVAEAVLEQTCYQCHPGKDTKCLRGAMARGGAVCQDCHGSIVQVGREGRDPWASEPACGSCHTGDAVNNLANTPHTVVNPDDYYGNDDRIRLALAYQTNDLWATPIEPANRRFAESLVSTDTGTVTALYRNSSGHGGMMCEACHGPTHAEWPAMDGAVNDNLTATVIQGHSGTIIECGSCHNAGFMSQLTTEDSIAKGLAQKGPHGMHPVNNQNWIMLHKKRATDSNLGECKACHGQNLRGTVLSKAAANRTFMKGSNLLAQVSLGTPIGCNLCHKWPK